MFRTIPLSIIRSFSLYAQQWYMSYRFCRQQDQDIRPDPARKLSAKPVWHIPLLCVQWKTPDDGQRNCPKHVEFYSKHKFEKLANLLGGVMRMYHDARSSERQTTKVFYAEQRLDRILCYKHLIYLLLINIWKLVTTR